MRLRCLGATAVASVCWGLGMARFTDAAAPVIDAAVAGMSVAAQLLQSLRRVEAWMGWIAVNLVATPLYFSRGLYPTTALFAVFLILAVAGLAGAPRCPLTHAGLGVWWFTPVVGACGAFFGGFGARLALNRHLGRSSSALYLTLAINAAFGFLYPGISWQAFRKREPS